MTTANKITVLRIFLVPVFIAQMLYYVGSGDERHRLAALLCFAVAAISDGVDGYIARRYHQQSELGLILDPLADKLLGLSAIVLLSLNNHPHFERIPLWLTIGIISRDVIQLIGVILIRMNGARLTIRPRLSGKLATACQMILVSWLLLQWHDAWVPVWIIATGFFTGVSGLQYVMDGLHQLNASPPSSPT